MEEEAQVPTYEQTLDCLSSLITRRTRADASNKGDSFDLLFDYLKILDLEGAVSSLSVIHVAGTKGKGSTCAFAEGILRSCGFRTGLFTSPHLIDVRERFKLDGMEISEEKFVSYFWWCWNRLQEKTNDDVPMPNYFRFLALLSFKIFSAEKVDVAILEVGLGGKFDATNVVQEPVVCGVSSLGHDHMEILGNTLGQIAGEKAGIFKKDVPAYTVPQPEEAMNALKDRASQLGITLLVAPALTTEALNGQKLGLDGDHQYVNAGLAASLCHAWLKRTKNMKDIHLDDSTALPEQFIKGLRTTSLRGRAQIVPDPQNGMQFQGKHRGEMIFYLDGAHSPESMEVCASWFSSIIKKKTLQQTYNNHDTRQILLFNCMSVRDPWLLLPRLVNACTDKGIIFHKAFFVPSQSVFNKVVSHATPLPDQPQVDLSWQQTLQKVWEDLQGGKCTTYLGEIDSNPSCTRCQESSSVIPSLPLAINLLRDVALQSPSVCFQILVTGSLHLVGDVLKILESN